MFPIVIQNIAPFLIKIRQLKLSYPPSSFLLATSFFYISPLPMSLRDSNRKTQGLGQKLPVHSRKRASCGQRGRARAHKSFLQLQLSNSGVKRGRK